MSYIDSTRGLKAFLLRVLKAHKDGSLASHWFNESSKKSNVQINEWYVVGGERKHYGFLFDLIRDVFAKLGKVTEKEIVEFSDNIEYRNIYLGERGRAFFMAEFKKEDKVAPAVVETVVEQTESVSVDALVEPEPTVEEKPAPKKRGKAKKA